MLKQLYTFKTTKAGLFVSRLNDVTEITTQYPSQSHDFKKGAKGSVVVFINFLSHLKSQLSRGWLS